MAQKIVQYQAVLQLAQTAPQIYDMPYLHRQMLEVLGIQNAQKLVPLKDNDDMKPRDPVSENMDVINGKPVKAFIYQDHQAHIAVHMAAMQDPQIQQLMGQNPNAQVMQAAMMAHVNEHIAFEYRKQIEEQAGVMLPAPDSELAPDVELQISRLAAAASAQLMQKKQAEAAQQAAQQAAEDPLVQLQQQELAIKQKEVDIKEKKLLLDATAQTDKMDLEEKRIEAQTQIAGMQVGAKVATSEAQLSAQQQEAGLKMGVQIAQSMVAQQQQAQTSNSQEQPAKEQ
jgi:hypothetical protein